MRVPAPSFVQSGPVRPGLRCRRPGVPDRIRHRDLDGAPALRVGRMALRVTFYRTRAVGIRSPPAPVPEDQP